MKCTIVTKRRRLGRGGSSRPVRLVGNAQGLILPLTLLVMVILGALAAAILSIGGSEAHIASNHLRAIQAQFLAEAGLEHAFNRINVLWNGSRASLTTNAGSLQPVPGIEANTPLGGAGNYTVQYQAAGLWTWRVVSTGAGAIGESQQIRRAVMSTFFTSPNAIMVNGSLDISGNTNVASTNGQCGNVHANGDLTLQGNAVINGDATESNNDVNVIGSSVVVAGVTRGYTPTETVPHIDPAALLADLKSNPDVRGSLNLDHLHQMKANGEVRDGNGGLITTLNNQDTHCGWTYTSGATAEWRFNDNTVPLGCDGTFYFEGNATVSGSPGDATDKWETTLIATGDINISGEPNIGADASYTVHDTLFYAGGDVKIQGNPSNSVTYDGLIAAHEQFELGGTTTITGFIIGENAPNTHGSLVNSNNNIVNANVSLTYDCGSNPPLQGPLRFLSWGL